MGEGGGWGGRGWGREGDGGGTAVGFNKASCCCANHA